MSQHMVTPRLRRTVGSMLWAAWADALGFISELTTESGLNRRLRGRPLTEPVEWTRRVGGKFGVEVTLPAGCYSDDTQLRLATARSIHGRGFDVEAFARVELPIWPTYALGGGRSSKAAAANMAKPATPWFGNFYHGWLNGGGNGVAMRIQPHVWAAPEPATIGDHICDVIVNGVVSHGHPRALVGAVVHALALGDTLNNGYVPPPQRWPGLLDAAEQAVKLVDEHSQLASLWRPAWERQMNASFAEAWRQTVEECRQMLPVATASAEHLSNADSLNSSAARLAYGELVSAFSLRDPAKRGSGTTTVMAALALAAAALGDPAEASRLAAQMIGTDTDTIATMAAAMIGASDAAPEPPNVLDTAYLTAEATRLAKIADGEPTVPFSYPDLLTWLPPRSQVDAVGTTGSRIALAGLGWLEQLDGTEPTSAQDAEWLWTCSDFGASFLVKRRSKLRELPSGNWPSRRDRLVSPPSAPLRPAEDDHPRLFDPDEPAAPAVGLGGSSAIRSGAHPPLARKGAGPGIDSTPQPGPLNIDQMLSWLSRHGFADGPVGYAIKRISDLGTLEQYIAFTTALRAEMSRVGRNNYLPSSDLPVQRELAEKAVISIERSQGWNDMPVLFWQSIPHYPSSLLPGLHDPDGIRGALQRYRALRPSGFNFAKLESRLESVSGGIRIRDSRSVIDVRPQGIITAAATATEEMLGHAMSRSAPGRLNVVALSEMTLEYYRLVDELLLPHIPGNLQHRIIAARFGGKEQRQLWPGTNHAFPPARAPQTLDDERWDQFWPAIGDMELDAYQALVNIYALFGLSVTENPYITGRRLDLAKLEKAFSGP